uniref:Ig-like domain-containing protein n=1 Tax=Astatotilapia calliptera TaxID=8154 RepID=A0A3P8PLN4_ASTCA
SLQFVLFTYFASYQKLLLESAVAQTVVYPFTSTCAVRGSTVTLPCTFTPRKSFSDGQREVPLKIVRVRWCKNHVLCQGSMPSVYDSNSANIDPRYQYLGDKKTNCTLQIRDVQQGDNASFRFRMEADRPEGHFTNQTGVNVTVLSRGENVTLLCASVCTFHQLEVTWFKDGHALSDTGPSLHLSPLTAEDSGNYTCALKKSMETLSEPYSLQVEAGGLFSFLKPFLNFKTARTQETLRSSGELLCATAFNSSWGISQNSSRW